MSITDAKIDELLKQLDDIAVNTDSYEYGLPLNSVFTAEVQYMRSAVRRWVERHTPELAPERNAEARPVARTESWQPIDTAPKDGMQILMYCIPNEVPSLKHHVASGYWRSTDGFLKPGTWRFNHAVGPSFMPTHWMPLPEPPAAATKGTLP